MTQNGQKSRPAETDPYICINVKPLPLGHNISNDFSKFPAAHEKPEKVALI